MVRTAIQRALVPERSRSSSDRHSRPYFHTPSLTVRGLGNISRFSRSKAITSATRPSLAPPFWPNSLLVTLAASSLIYALVTTDFSIRYVPSIHPCDAGLLSRHRFVGWLEGSLLLWEWILIIFSVWWPGSTVTVNLKQCLGADGLFHCLRFFSASSPSFPNPFRNPSRLAAGRPWSQCVARRRQYDDPSAASYTGSWDSTVPYAFAMAALIRASR